MKKRAAANVGIEHKLVRMWGKTLMSAGFVGFPSAVIRYQDQLRLSSVELNVLLQIADHWWTPERLPFPSKGLIAQRMRIRPRSVQRVVARLEARGLIERVKRNYMHGGKSYCPMLWIGGHDQAASLG